jgi:hypothetical protein
MAKSKAKYHGIPGEKTRQCEASKKDGTRCRQSAIQGLNVCRSHGGGTKLAREAARVRLAALVDPALRVLAEAMKARVPTQHRLTAARDVLDRNGLKAKDEVVIHTEFDATKFANWSTEDLELFVSLARRATTVTAVEHT